MVDSIDKFADLKSRFIVDENLYNAERLTSDVEKLLQYCKLTTKGRVIITAKGLTDKTRIAIIVFARYLAHKLDKSIPDLVSTEEMAALGEIQKSSVRGRTTDLVDGGLIVRVEQGQFRAVAASIDDFFEMLRSPKAT
ncbi:MAG: hypothetical protein O7B30_01485 [Thaumarchaeota archaeon]|jgi:hypothetical protein|nr:hypothetical protein [Nitrososphaerota archaeon]